MSLRAIKKQQQAQSTFSTTKQTLFKKYNSQNIHSKQQKQRQKESQEQQQRVFNTSKTREHNEKEFIIDLGHQRALLGRLIHSNPELSRNLKQEPTNNLRRKSENDITTLIAQCSNNSQAAGILSAQSEVCLQTISSHYYHHNHNHHQQQHQHQQNQVDSETNNNNNNNNNNTMSGARSHKDLSSHYGSQFNQTISVMQPMRRMSESSLSSTYSQQVSSTSAMTTMTICGYEIIEERARFTVYKLRVENENNCWLVLRRYTDFVRLKNKLEQAFPRIHLILPRKKIFGDNFNSVFLDNRVQGLQMFVNSVMAKEELRRCKIVREFFCLDEPPSYSESMEECRAIFEAQEETISHLKTQISSKNELILSLQKKLRDELLEKEKLKQVITTLSSKVCSNCSTKVCVDQNK